MAFSSSVAITIVTYNSIRYIRRCLEYVLAASYPNPEIVIIDNASADGTQEILREFEGRARVAYNSVNRGFAGGQNQAIGLTSAQWILTLNPDVRLTPQFLNELLSAIAARPDERIGSVCGKLLVMKPAFEPADPPVFDSTGIYMTPNMRHFDRGSLQPDHGQFDQSEFVFGATGAACLYRREMINDVSINGEFFDDDFFAYREDADVAWRAQLLGWKCLYVPRALAYHVRSVLPTNRSSLSAAINMHSVKNRWLLRIKNVTPALYKKYLFRITARDLVVIAGCLVREWSSLKGFVLVGRAWRRAWRKRAEIMSKRKATDEYINSWFADRPAGFLALPKQEVVQAEKMLPR